MTERNGHPPPLITHDEDQGVDTMLESVENWMKNSTTFMLEQKRKVKEIAMGPMLFGVKEYLPKSWIDLLICSGLIDKSRLDSLGPLNEEEHTTLSLAEQLLERSVQLMSNKGDLKLIINFIHDVEQRPLLLEGVVDQSYALQKLFEMHIFTSMWASIRRIYVKKKKSHAGVCVIYFFKIIQLQVLHYGMNGSDKIDFTREKILSFRKKELASSASEEIAAENLCNSANKAFNEKDYEKAVRDYTQAFMRNPFDALFMSNRAQANLYLKKFRDAFWDSKRAILLAPNNSKNYYRCAVACIEFGWLEDAKEMNDKSRENSEREDEKNSIMKQAHAIEEKKEEMKGMKEQKTADVEVVYTCTDTINFRKLLIIGYNQFQRHQYQQSVETFQQALEYVSDLGLERLRVDKDDLHVISYSLGTALVESGSSHNLLTAIEKFSLILTEEKLDFPAAYYGIVKAYKQLNRFKEAATYAEQGLEVLEKRSKVDKDQIYLWPASENVIEESKHSVLKKLLKDLLLECQYPPKPDAFCRIHSDTENPRQEIYFSDPDYKGCVKLTCHQKCSLDYHISCWKAFRSSLSEKYLDKTMIDTQCPTPDCGSTINSITIFRSSEETPVQFVSYMKENAKPPRPIVRQKMTEPVKLMKKEEKKKQRRQRKAEIIEKLRIEEQERAEFEKAQNEKAARHSSSGLIHNKKEAIYKGEATVLLKDEPEVLLEGKQKSSKSKKKKDKTSKQVLAFDVQFTGDEEKTFYSATSMDPELELREKFGLLPTPGSGAWPMGNGLLPVPTSLPRVDEMAENVYEFFSDFFQANGPQDIDSPILRDWLLDFPEEITKKIDSFGGLEHFILANKRFALVGGRILCNATDQNKAMAMSAGVYNGKASGMGTFPASSQPKSNVSSGLQPAKKPPAFSWEERAKQMGQPLTKPSVEAMSAVSPEPPLNSAWSSVDPIFLRSRGGVGTLPTAPRTLSENLACQGRKESAPDADESTSSQEDGFVTVGSRKKALSAQSVSSSASQLPAPTSEFVKLKGAHFLTRAEAAAKLDVTDQESHSGPARVVLRDDVSDVTTHSSDSTSVMDMIEELSASVVPLAGGANHPVSVRSDRLEDGLTETASLSSHSNHRQGLLGNVSGNGVSSNGHSKPFPQSTMMSNLEAGSAPGSRRDSDASVRSEDFHRSCSPASQGSSGSCHSQPVPLKPLKPLAGIRRGKAKSTREGHVSRISNLVKSESGGSSSSLEVVADSNSVSVGDDTAKEKENPGKSGTNSDLESFIMEEISKSKEKRKGDVDGFISQLSKDQGREELSSQGRDEVPGSIYPPSELTTSTKGARGLLGMAQFPMSKGKHLPFGLPKLANPVDLSSSNISSSIWDPIAEKDSTASAPDISESREALGKHGFKIDLTSSHPSMKEIWSRNECDETEHAGDKRPFSASDPFLPSQSTTQSESSAFFMPSFADALHFPIGGLIDKTQKAWPPSDLNSTEKTFDGKVSSDSMVVPDSKKQSSIWGQIGLSVSSSAPSFVPPSLYSNAQRPLTSSVETDSYIPASSSMSQERPNPMGSSFNLNPFSKEFVPGKSATNDFAEKTTVSDELSDLSESREMDAPVTTVRTSEGGTQTTSVSVCSTAVNTLITKDQIKKMFEDYAITSKAIETLKGDLETERERRKKLEMILEGKSQELGDKDVMLEKLRKDSVQYEKHYQSLESEMVELKKNNSREHSRAIDSEKRFLHMMSQLLAQKLKSRKAEGQKHVQQLTQAIQSLKVQNVEPPSTIVIKAREWEVFDSQCDFQLTTLSTVYGRYTDLLDQGLALEALPDITARVTIPEMPKAPTSWDDSKETPTLTATSSFESSVFTQLGVNEPPPQSNMLKRTPTKGAMPSAFNDTRMPSNNVPPVTSPPGFKKMPPLTLPSRQRYPKTNSLASQVSSNKQASAPPSSSMTAYEQIVTDLQNSHPTLSRDAVSRMIRDLRQSKGGQLSQMNIHDINKELSAMAIGHEDIQKYSSHEPSLGDVIHLSRSNSEDDLCPICHEELSCMETQALQCSHRFHDSCIKQWFKHQRNCPVCRVHSLHPEEFPSLR